ncbi:hypothetical protein TCA2_5909 [Paenibacillus sp. TCA20]|nr:hypothetical protein TCA2_5909 [Paenibacillus sp. TCA20]SDX85774.1 hypothetical protein SAMN05518848_12027 [Paenibacillus sp. PDC88]
MYEPIFLLNEAVGSSYWERYSYKLQKDVQLFGDLKYDHWILVETDPNILKFCERPNSEKLLENNLHKIRFLICGSLNETEKKRL